jgi:hypothetical protein
MFMSCRSSSCENLVFDSNWGQRMNFIPIVIEELVRAFNDDCERPRQPASRFGRLERFTARGEDLFFESAGLPGHEYRLGTLRVDADGLIKVRHNERHFELRYESLANPRCFARLLTSAEEYAERWIGGMYHEFESTKDYFLIQRLTALKAFFLAFDAIQTSQRAKLLTSLAEILELLENEETDHPLRIRHEVLYRLAQASCRLDEPYLVLEAAKYGLNFRQIGSFSPISRWKKIVDAVCRAAREKNMNHRRKQRPRLPYGNDAEDVECLRRVAECIADVPKQTLDRLGPFLRHGTLEDLARFQRIF